MSGLTCIQHGTWGDSCGPECKRLTDAYPNQEYVEAVTMAYQANTRNPQQAEIAEQAQDLLDTLEKLVPRTTVHYAVEDARKALANLLRQAHTIHTQEPT